MGSILIARMIRKKVTDELTEIKEEKLNFQLNAHVLNAKKL